MLNCGERLPTTFSWQARTAGHLASPFEVLTQYLFEIIDPYSINKQGQDVGEKYRTGIYSRDKRHLEIVSAYIAGRVDSDRIVVEVLPLKNYVPSDQEHQDRLTRFPEDYCHIPLDLLHKYKNHK